MRYLPLVVLLLLALAGVAGCSNDDPVGPSVNNAGDNNAFNFSDDSNGPSSATVPGPVVIPPVFAPVEGPAPIIITPGTPATPAVP